MFDLTEETKIETKNLKYLTFGSPIIDLIVDVDKSFVDKYDIKLDTTSHVKGDDRIFTSIRDLNPVLTAGGCSYNAIRTLNWMLGKNEPFSVGGIGSVGKDNYGFAYKKILESESIVPLFEIMEGFTAKCATICYLRERCHLTDLGVSSSISDLFIEKQWDLLENIELLYTELYILSHKKSTLLKLANLCLNDKKIFGFNLPSLGFLDAFKIDILEMMGYADIIFANLEEAKHFVHHVLDQSYDDLKDLAIKMASQPKVNKNKKRTAVVTCGPDQLYVVIYNPKTDTVEFQESFTPFTVSNERIIDTNGAGDSFAGGFLAQYVQGHDIEICVKSGNYCAANIIQRRGFELPRCSPPTKDELKKMDFNTEIINKREYN